MKTRFLIIVLLTLSVIIMPGTSFAQKPVDCYFGDDSVSIDEIFRKDVAVKAFTEKHSNAIRHAAIEQAEPLHGEVSFTANDNYNKEEILLIKFNQNENGCYRPYDYVYSYDDGIIDVTVRDSLLNITEIINLIKLDDKKIENFYTKNCNAIQLNVVLEGNSKPYFCKSDSNGSIEMYAQKHVGGTIEVHIEEKVMDALFYNCVVDDFIVLNNGEEILYELVAEEGKKIFKMDFLPGYNKAEIVGFSHGGSDGFCGSIWSDDSRYISPHLQAKIGVESWMIKCNDGLALLLKPAEFTKPACVTDEAYDKLSDRGWISEPNNSDHHVIQYSPVLFKGTDSTLDGGNGFTLEEFQKLQQRKIELDMLLEDRSIPEKIQDKLSDERNMIQHYSQQAFGEGVPFETITMLSEKRIQLKEFLSAHDREERFPVDCTGSISVGFHAYSLDEKYVGNPTALTIKVSPEHFTKTNLQKADKIVREQIGEEVDIVYEKSDCYTVPINGNR